MKGFTLIELLIVVLIAGILTSIALPQYQQTVEKSIAAEAISNGKAIVDAQNRSLSAFPNDSVATKSALDIVLRGGSWTSDNTYTTKQFKYTLSNAGVAAARIDSENYQYTLTFYNENANRKNSCQSTKGSICSVMLGMGFE